MTNDHPGHAALQQFACNLPTMSARRGFVTGGFMRSEQSKYLAMVLGGLAMGLAVVFLALYTALRRPFEF